MADPAKLLVDNVIALTRFDRGLRMRSTTVLRQAITEIVTKLLRDYPDLTYSQRQRTLAMLKSFERILGQSYKEVADLTASELKRLSVVEGRFSSQLLNTVMTNGGISPTAVNVSAAQLKAIVDLPIQGAQLGEWWKTQGQRAIFEVRRNIQLGLLQGETTQQITRRILAASRNTTGDVMGTIERNASSLVRTSINAISNAAKFETFSQQDNDVTDSYQYTATLDEKTTILCAALDGRIYKYSDKRAPRPPMHINCRSTIIPVINWKKLGLREADEIVPLMRASKDGPTSNATFSAWLKKQPVDVQNEVLGRTRARLFRDGEISLRELIAKDNTTLTLEELANKLGVSVEDL